MIGRRLLVGLCVTAALFTACDSDDGDSAADKGETSTTTTTASPGTSASTSPPTTTPAGQPCTGFPESSPAQFDAKGGKYAVYLTKLDVGKRLVGFDVIQFLGGEAAVQAYKKDNPGETDGPPNDYYIVNESAAVREATVSASAAIVVIGPEPSQSRTITLAELPAHLSQSESEEPRMSSFPYWLTLSGGTVTEVCQQYVP